MLNGQKIVVLCMSRLFDTDHHKFVMQLNEKFKKENISLWIYHINTDLYWNEEHLHAESAVFDLIDYQRTDAVILMDEKIKSRTVSNKIISQAHAANVPVLTVDAEYPACSSLCFDYKAGFEAVVRHVMEVHHAKNPHFMAGIKGNPFSDERMDVFREVIEEYGIAFDEESMVSYGYFWAQPAAEATEKLIQRENMPDAIICANDIMAINVVSALRSHGISVPEQVIVTGFDGIDEIYFSAPAITSVKCVSSGLTEQIYQSVMACLENPETVQRIYAKPALLINNSCGCKIPDDKKQNFNFNSKFYRYQDDTQILYEISEKMQCCTTPQDAGYCIFCNQIQNASLIVNQWCTDNSVNHFEQRPKQAFEEEMFLFFRSGEMRFQQRPFRKAEVVPELEQIMKKGFPLILNAVSFLGVPLGYMCFYFDNYEMTNYCKIPQVVNILGQGLGGFMNWRYQHYLMKQLEFIYKYDALTGLLNRLCFRKEFAALKESLHGKTSPMAVILSDLDGLKKINDVFGHNAGDNAIRTVAEALKQACPPGALCVRFGGDEMLAVIAGDYQVSDIIHKIHAYLDNYNQHSGLEYKISSSVGGYTGVLSADMEFGQMLQKADAAMYAQKQEKHRKAKL